MKEGLRGVSVPPREVCKGSLDISSEGSHSGEGRGLVASNQEYSSSHPDKRLFI